VGERWRSTGAHSNMLTTSGKELTWTELTLTKDLREWVSRKLEQT